MQPAAILSIFVNANTSQATASLAKTQAQLKGTTATANSTAQVMRGRLSTAANVASKAVGAGLVYGLYKGTKAGMDFEKQMDNLGAVAEANRKEMKKLQDQALDLGKKTAFSAGEVADAQTELAKGGLKVKDILGGALPAALSLAAAGELQLGEAAETTVNAMKLFGLQAGKAGKVADMLATAANTTTADVGDFAMALKQGGSAAKAAGLDMNDTITILEALAEAGIKNSDAGTSMKTAFLQLLAPTEKQSALAKQLGLNFIDANGELKDAAGISSELQDALGGMTKAQQAANLKTLAGTDGFRTLSALYDAGPAKLDKLARANQRQGTAQEVAKKKMDNTAGSVEQLMGSLETLAIKGWLAIAPTVRKAVDKATGLLDDFTDDIDKLGLAEALKRAAEKVAKGAANLGMEAAGAFAKAWFNADILGKLFSAAALLRVFGGKAGFALVGGTIAKSITGALAPAFTRISMSTAGTALGLGLMKATSLALPGAVAAVGLADAVSSAVQGNTHDALFKAGGSLAGGIAGGLVGGLPGALVGSGLGSVLGGLVGGLFDSGNKLSKMQEKLRDSSKAMRGAYSAQQRASKNLAKSSAEVRKAHRRDKSATAEVQRAERRLAKAREKYPAESRPVLSAERGVAIAKDKSRKATKRLERAEKLSGVQRRIYKDTAKAAVQAEKDRVSVLKEQRKGLMRQYRAAKRSNIPLSEMRPLLDKLNTNSQQLSKTQRTLGNSLADASKKVGPDFARRLRKSTTNTLEFGQAGKVTIRNVLDPLGQRSIPRVDKALDQMGATTKNLKDKWGKNTDIMRGDFWNFGSTVYNVQKLNETNTNKPLGVLGGSPKPFGLVKPKKRQRGGLIPGLRTGALVPGQGSGDKVPLHINGQLAAIVEPGEMVSVANRNATKALMDVNSKIPRFAVGGVVPAVSKAISAITGRFPGIAVSSTTGGRHAANSYHYRGMAADLASGDYGLMDKAAAWIKQSMGPSLLEGIHNPNLSIKDGHSVSPSFWGAQTWAGHANHIHIALNALGKIAGAGKIKRLIFGGPDGTLKGTGQTIADRTRKAANAFLSKQMPTQAGATSGAIPKGKGRTVGTSVYGFGEPGTGTVGYRGDDLRGKMAFAELGMGTALGGLPYMAPLRISANGRSVIAKKMDIGLGGGSVDGHPRALDLWEDTAKALGLGSTFLGLTKIQKLMRGGRVQRFAKGGGVGKLHSALDADLSPAKKLADRLRKLQRRIARTDERIEIATTLAGLDSSERGSDLGPGEQFKQIKLNRRLVSQLRRQARLSAHGVKLADRLMDKAGPGQKGKLRDMRSTFREALVDATGVTGKGGRIFDTRTQLDTLRHTPTSAFDSLDLGGLRDIIQLARYGGFDGLPKFHRGGVVPGPRGSEQPIMAAGGERIYPPGTVGGGVSVHNEISIDLDRMEALVMTTVDDRLAKRERIKIKSGRQVGV